MKQYQKQKRSGLQKGSNKYESTYLSDEINND